MKIEYIPTTKQVLFIHEDEGELFVPGDRLVFEGTIKEAYEFFSTNEYDCTSILTYILRQNPNLI